MVYCHFACFMFSVRYILSGSTIHTARISFFWYFIFERDKGEQLIIIHDIFFLFAWIIQVLYKKMFASEYSLKVDWNVWESKDVKWNLSVNLKQIRQNPNLIYRLHFLLRIFFPWNLFFSIDFVLFAMISSCSRYFDFFFALQNSESGSKSKTVHNTRVSLSQLIQDTIKPQLKHNKFVWRDCVYSSYLVFVQL